MHHPIYSSLYEIAIFYDHKGPDAYHVTKETSRQKRRLNMPKSSIRPKEPEDKDKYCYSCKAYGDWKRDCNIKNKKQYTEHGKIAAIRKNKIVKKEEVKYLPGNQKAQKGKCIKTEENITEKNETAWAKEKEDYLKTISTLTKQLNEETLRHRLTKHHLTFAISQRKEDRKHFYTSFCLLYQKEKKKKEEDQVVHCNTNTKKTVAGKGTEEKKKENMYLK